MMESESKYEVLTLHREFDNICIVRLSGYDSSVFWREIKLNPRFSFFRFRSPREKILKAQEKAAKKAKELEWSDQLAAHEFDVSVRESK